jgi:hypothetical protein
MTDVANLLASYLQLWLESLPPLQFGTWQARCEAATIPIAQIQHHLIALMEAYGAAAPDVASLLKLASPSSLTSLPSHLPRIL